MDEGDVVEGGSLCGGGAMKEGSVTQRKWIRKGYFIMHQIRKFIIYHYTQSKMPPN